VSVRLEAIKFNHDPGSATSDAFSIRRNATQPVAVPEWQWGVSVNPEDSPAAYAMKETQGQTITIQAKLRSLDPELGSVHVRAVDPTYQPHPGPGGCLGWLAWILELLVRLLQGNVLGEVKARKVTFPAGGVTGFETFELKHVNIQGAGVGARTTTWRWQYRRHGGAWTDFETTQHRIYVVAEVPKAPWNQAPGSTQLPWTEVLDYACKWALLAKTAGEAAARVTRAVYDLGPSVVTYDCPGGGSSHYAGWSSFDATHFLERLKGGLGNGIYVNCTDCATITSTFANALGADLWQSRMEPPPASPAFGFDLNPMLGIGSAVWQTCCGWGAFSYHEVAWKDACTATDAVYDACLQVDGDADPTTPPHTPLLPVNLTFGGIGAGLYRDRLASPSGRPNCEPNPGSRQRRSVA
jgi:hypothetical protein